MSKGSPIRMAQMAAGRMASARHQRRAADAAARKFAQVILKGTDGGKSEMSIPAMKKLIRRNNQKKGQK